VVLRDPFVLERQEGCFCPALQREIGVTHKTATRILHQIRVAMGNAKHKQVYDAFIEMDGVCFKFCVFSKMDAITSSLIQEG